MTTPDDGALAERVSRHDRAAEAELCERLRPRLYALALVRLRDPASAHDVAQESLAIAIERLRERALDDPSRVAAFVLGIASHVASATRRGERRRAAILDRVAPTIAATTVIDETVADTARLRECFERLAPRARAILALTFYADRDGDEIACELAMSASHVRVSRHRALLELHACVTGSR